MANLNPTVCHGSNPNVPTAITTRSLQSDLCTTCASPGSQNPCPPLCANRTFMYVCPCSGPAVTGSLASSISSSQPVTHTTLSFEATARRNATTTVHGYLPRESSSLVIGSQVTGATAPVGKPMVPNHEMVPGRLKPPCFPTTVPSSSSLVSWVKPSVPSIPCPTASSSSSSCSSSSAIQRLPAGLLHQWTATTRTCTDPLFVPSKAVSDLKAKYPKQPDHTTRSDTTASFTNNNTPLINDTPACVPTNSTIPHPVARPEVQDQRTGQAEDLNHVSPQNPLPHWNMRWSNVLRYPKYSTRKNSGFERRLKQTGLILDPKLTLRLLRKVLQPFINNAVNNVLQHYMEEYISSAVRNIRDNLGETAVTDKDLMRFRRSVMQRVAMQYFSKEDLSVHETADSDLCDHIPSGAIASGTDRRTTATHGSGDVGRRDGIMHPSSRVRGRKPVDPEGSLHRRIVQNNWGARFEHGLISSSCTPSPGLSPAVSDGLDGSTNSLLDEALPAQGRSQMEKTSVHEDSLTRSTSAISSPATSDHRLGLTSIPLAKVPLGNASGSMPVSSRSTSPHTPSSASSCSTLGYFFNTLSHSDDDDDVTYGNRADQSDDLHLLDHNHTEAAVPPLNQHTAPRTHDRRRSRRATKRATSWWNWGSTRRSRPKRPRHDHPPNHMTSDKDKTTLTGHGRSWRDEQSRSKSAQPHRTGSDSSARTDDCKPKSTNHTSGTEKANPRFLLNQQTVFTLGSSANTWLGMGAARGRIYTKHPELFRYQCDSEDKAWLVRNGLLASHGVKAYLMHSDQVRYIGRLNGRAHSPDADGSQSDSLQTFTVPSWLVQKVILMASSHPNFSTGTGTTSSTRSVSCTDSSNRPAPEDRMAPSNDGGDGSGGQLPSNFMVGLDVELVRCASRDGHTLDKPVRSEDSTPPDRPGSSLAHPRCPSLSGNRQTLKLSTPPNSVVDHRSDRDSWPPDGKLVESVKASTDLERGRGQLTEHRRVRVSAASLPSDNSAHNAKYTHSIATAQRNAQANRTRTAECGPDTKSPKSPPTLQRFDYT